MATVQDIEVKDSAARSAQAAEELPEIQDERMVLNMGPSHPATHGVLRIVLELDGEIITKADPDIGYLHRGDEKIAENMTYTQFIPYTDRLDYLAPLANNVAYALAVEKLLGIHDKLPPRCQYIRVMCAELARISAHLLGLGAFAMDMGAVTVFLLILAGIVSANLFGLRMFQFNSTKLAATDWSRRTFGKISDEVHSCNSIAILNVDTNGNFVGLLSGETQQGNALQIYPTTNTGNYTIYFVNPPDQTFRRTASDQSSGALIRIRKSTVSGSQTFA